MDKTKTIYVTEGPIDGLFLQNSIAVAGSDFKKISEDIKDNAILIYDNEPQANKSSRRSKRSLTLDIQCAFGMINESSKV